MEDKLSITIIIETEETNNGEVFVALSPEINVPAEGKTIEEVREKFIEGVTLYLETFPEERRFLVKEEKNV